MKTGKDVIVRALRLLGYTDSAGESDVLQDAVRMRRGADAVMQIYEDVKRLDACGEAYKSLLSMNEAIPLSTATVDDVMPYGVAMLLAQSEGDAESQAFFAKVYSQKRMAVPRKTVRRRDVLPRGGCE